MWHREIGWIVNCQPWGFSLGDTVSDAFRPTSFLDRFMAEEAFSAMAHPAKAKPRPVVVPVIATRLSNGD